MSPGGGARICCLSHRVASQDTQIGESFIPFSALTSGKDYTETLVRGGSKTKSSQGCVCCAIALLYCVFADLMLLLLLLVSYGREKSSAVGCGRGAVGVERNR